MIKIVQNNLLFVIFILSLLFIISSIVSTFYYIKVHQMLKIGFPFVYYLEFQLQGNEFKNFSWVPKNLIIDILFNGILSVSFIFLYSIRKNSK